MKSTRMGLARAAGTAIVVVTAMVSTPARALDLQTVLSEVAASNPALEAQRARVTAAESGVSPAGSWPSPRLQFGLQNVPTSGSLDQEPMTQKRIALSQKFPVFGRAGLSRESASAGVAAEWAATENKHWMLLGQAWAVYASAYAAAERTRIAESHQGAMTRMVESARARYESGSGRLEDVLRARSAAARLLVDIEMSRAEAQRARAQLDALRGVDAAAPQATEVQPPPATQLDSDDAQWVQAALNQHPRLRELDAREAGHRLASRASRRKAWPDLELQLAYGFRETLAATGKAQDDMWSALVAFDLPIFAGGREGAEGEQHDALADAALSDRRAAALELESNILSAVAEARASQRSVELLRDAVVATQRRALDASWTSYSAGSSDLWRTLEAEHALYNEEIQLTRARESLGRAEGQLIMLTGRGDLLGVDLPEAVVERRQP